MLIHTKVHEMMPAFKDWSGVSNEPCVENVIVLTINCNQGCIRKFVKSYIICIQLFLNIALVLEWHWPCTK